MTTAYARNLLAAFLTQATARQTAAEAEAEQGGRSR